MELNTSRGVVKHPIQKKIVRKELNTYGGVVKHPKNIKEEYFKRNLTLLGEWLSILKISKRNTSKGT
jgi:hypothetical protein